MNQSQHVISETEPTDRSLDSEWLGRWVQSQHLSDEALADYSAEYEVASVPYIQVPQFLRSSVAEKLHTLLASEAEYEDVYGLRVPDERVEESVWRVAEESNRLFKYSRLADVRPSLTSFNPLVYMKLNKAMEDPRFITFFERITNTPLGTLQAFGGKSFGVGDYLRPHHDQGFNRRLAFIIYLSQSALAAFVWRDAARTGPARREHHHRSRVQQPRRIRRARPRASLYRRHRIRCRESTPFDRRRLDQKSLARETLHLNPHRS